jgi:hypothetical protein
MQSVPVDLLAGPIAKHKPQKLAAKPQKPAAKAHKLASQPHETPAKVVKSSIPALRLANDRL